MGSHLVEVLRQGLWASLTGGWFYDPHLSLFSNTFHLYVWLALFIIPFVIKLTTPKWAAVIAWMLYSIAIGVFFIIIKIINYKLHTLFDTSEKIAAPQDSQTNDSGWTRAQSCSPTSLEQIELDTFHQSSSVQDSRHTSPTDNLSNPDTGANVTTADVERGATQGASGGNNIPPILSLDDITSMEDITSLEDLQLDELKTDVASAGPVDNSPDRVRRFRRTVKAMSTQVTPQTSPLVGYKRRALSQERWPVATISGATPPLTLKRQQPHYHSQRVTRRRNVTYRRRSKSVLDSPHGSHMLVGESRMEERPPLTLEWAGYPHPSPRPRHRHRQMSLEEPLSGFAGRRYSLDLKPPRRDRPRDHHGAVTQSSNILMRTDSERLEDINALRDNLLSHTHNRKISTVSEPAGPYGESESSDDSERFITPDSTVRKNHIKPIKPPSKSDADSSPLQSQELREATSSNPDSLPEQATSANEIGECGQEPFDKEVIQSTATDPSRKEFSHSADNVNNSNNEQQKDRKDANKNGSTKPAAGSALSGAAASCQTAQIEVAETSAAPLSVVEEVAELERPRNPTPTAATSSYAMDAESMGGAIPKKGSKYNNNRGARLKSRHASADGVTISEKSDTNDGKDVNPSPNSSVSGSENTALLLAAKSDPKSLESSGSQVFDRAVASNLKRRPAVRRHTTAETRGSVRRARYYGSGSRSSWGSRWSGRSHRHSYSEPAAAASPEPTGAGAGSRAAGAGSRETDDQWHYFQDGDGCWYKYTFDSTSDGLPISLGKDYVPWAGHGAAQGATNCCSGDMELSPHSRAELPPEHGPFPDSADRLGGLPYDLELRALAGLGIGNLGSLMRTRLNGGRRESDESSETTIHIERIATPSVHRPKQFYRWKISPRLPSIKIWLDRLSLLSLLDRNVTKKENIASVLLAVIVTCLASVILVLDYYQDIYILLFCFVVAGCQYSLLKSVQPDAASPTHGYNNVIVYSRAFYFSVICLLIILLDTSVSALSKDTKFTLFDIDLVSAGLLEYGKELLKVLMLCLPLMFTFGLLPQVNTFMQYLLEQIEIHIFGGNGTTSLLAALYTVIHSTLAVAVLYGMAFVPIELIGRDASKVSDVASHATFSVFSGVLLSLSYHYSRMSSDPTHLWMLVKSKLAGHDKSNEETQAEDGIKDPLPSQIRKSVYQRLRNDLIVCVVVAIFVFGIHVSTVFSANLQPTLHSALSYGTVAIGFLIHYLMGQLRKEYPWHCCARPILKSPERSQFNVTGPAIITWFERLYVWMRFVEKNLLYPAVFLSGISLSTPSILNKFGLYVGPLVLVMCSFKALRCAFSDTSSQYCVLALTQLAFNYDYHSSAEKDMFILNYALMLIFYSKFVDFYLKCKFIFVYIAPWQLAWGSAFHAFAQPLSVPHACMLFVQAAISALLYTPLNPLLGSAIFINSYMRTIKFWEKDYNTKRVDHSNIRLAAQVDNSLGSDDNNLNSIFYEHLTRSLQNMLCGDLMMGRWGEAHQGDMFIMASDYLNALVHIVEMGNGLVTFQLRGLEFRGTYCQQREVEAITEGVDDDIGFCCCNPGHLPHFLSANAAFGERWLAWEVTVSMYILDGYSITDNNAAGMLQVYDLRKVLISYYVKSVIFYTIRSANLMDWIEANGITANIDTNEDMASVFSTELDEDFDRISEKVTQRQFSRVYLSWIHHCLSKKAGLNRAAIGFDAESRLIRLCYALSLVARRALATAAHNNCASVNVEFFLHGLHSLFKGDFRITGPDEWIFKDIEFLRKVISPAIRLALKLHQDHFSMPEEYADHTVLYDTMVEHGEGLVITHEADPDWRNAVLSNRPSLLALRHVFDEGSNVYKIIMLNKRHLSFRIIKVNRECVRGLWAGQQQELVFLRNRNPERGSIQNAKQALRNMINSSCDQPIGYPIYVSPLTTSYAGTNDQLTSVLFGEVSLRRVKRFLVSVWQRIRLHCGLRCRNFGSPHSMELPAATPGATLSTTGTDSFRELYPSHRAPDIRTSTRQSSRPPPLAKPSTSSLPLGIGNFAYPTNFQRERPQDFAVGDANNPPQQETSLSCEPSGTLVIDTAVKITDMACIMAHMNRQRRADPVWPSVEIQKHGGASGWEGWIPKVSVQGVIAHKWVPCHSDIKYRSNTDKTIYLVKFGQYYVPVAEQGLSECDLT